MKTQINDLLNQIKEKTGWSDYVIARELNCSQYTVYRYRVWGVQNCKLDFYNNAVLLLKRINKK